MMVSLMSEDQDKIEPGDAKEVGIVTDRVAEIVCSKCGCEIDVSDVYPFMRVECPDCSNEEIVPTRLGPFLLLDLIGTGGMGGVYRARDEALGREVAVKVMLRSLGRDEKFVENFRREAQAAARLNHPNIVQIYSFGQEKGQPYIVMELVSGQGLDKMMAPGRQLPQEFLAAVGLGIAEGLAAAEEAGLIHGDIKPENILYDEKQDRAKLVDFGIATFANQRVEAEGSIWGTPYYIAPEKIRRQKVDARTDMYSLGATLYHALAGQPPFDGRTPMEVVKARLTHPPRPLRDVRPKIDRQLDHIIMRMIEPEPSRRYPTYASLIGDFRRAVAALGSSRPVRPPTIKTGRLVIPRRSEPAVETGPPVSSKPVREPPARGGARIVIKKTTTAGSFAAYKAKFSGQPVEQHGSPEGSSERTPRKSPSKGRPWVFFSLLVLSLGGVGAWRLYKANQETMRRRQEQLDIGEALTAVSNHHVEVVGLVSNIQFLALEAETHAAKASNAVFVVLSESLDLQPPEALKPAATNTEASAPRASPSVISPPTARPSPRNDDGEGPPPGEATREDIERRRRLLEGKASPPAVPVAPPAPAEPAEIVPAQPAAASDEPARPLEVKEPEIRVLAKAIRQISHSVRKNKEEAETLLASAGQRREVCYSLAHDAAEKRYAVRHSLTLRQHIKQYQEDMEKLSVLRNSSQEAVVESEKKLTKVLEMEKEVVEQREAEKRAREEAERLKREQQERERRAAEWKEKQEKELDALRAARAELTLALKQHAYQDMVKALTEKSAAFETDEAKARVRQLMETYNRLARMKSWLIERLNGDPFAWGWLTPQQDVLSADESGVRLKNRKVPWADVSTAQMLYFVDHYLRKARLREVYEYSLAAALFVYEQGEGRDVAIKKAVEYAHKALEALPDQKAEAKNALPGPVRDALD